MSLLNTLKPPEESLEFVLPRPGPLDMHSSRMASFIEEPFPPTLGGLARAWVVFDVRNHARIADHLPMVLGIKAAIAVEIGPCQHHTRHFGYALSRLQPF